MSLGVYIHFPYCRAKCRYCDFFSLTSPAPHEAYAAANCRELQLRRPQWSGRVAGSLYLGGGTPSLWEPAALGRALAAIRQAVPFEEGAEWTIEANPGTVDAPRLAALRALGLDRLSLGVQSFDDALLRQLGRIHARWDVLLAVSAARAAGFGEISLDLIYGLPGQTLAGAAADLDEALALAPEHLSIYELMVTNLEAPTPLARDVERGLAVLPDEEVTFEMGRAAVERAEAAGLARYEISSFARPGHRARHNQLYWNGGEYLGLGLGAVGFALCDPARPELGGRRWTNTRDPSRYFEALARGELAEADGEDLDAATLFEERLLLGLRQCEGLDLDAVGGALAIDPSEIAAIWRRAEPLIGEGWARRAGGRLWLTRAGLDLHGDLVLRLLG